MQSCLLSSSAQGSALASHRLPIYKSSKMPSKALGELLPPGWKLSKVIQSQVGDKGSFYLNDKATLEKLQGHAARTPMVVERRNDNSLSLQFSTGAYMESVSPLLSFWKEVNGKGSIDKDDTDGMEVKVTTIETSTDNGGKTVSTIVNLAVHGEKVTVTCFDTQVFMRVQGRQQMEQFFKRALLRYLEVEINKQTDQIKMINQHFQQLGSSGSKRRGQKMAETATSKRKANFKPSKVLAEQQLEVSDMESSEEDVSIVRPLLFQIIGPYTKEQFQTADRRDGRVQDGRRGGLRG